MFVSFGCRLICEIDVYGMFVVGLLIELLIVIAILIIIATYAIHIFSTSIKKSKFGEVLNLMKEYEYRYIEFCEKEHRIPSNNELTPPVGYLNANGDVEVEFEGDGLVIFELKDTCLAMVN